MAIRHRLSVPADHFTIIRNDWLRDERLSWKARGIVVYLASHRVGWETSLEQLARAGREGKDAVRAGLRELEALGYLKLDRHRNEDGTLAGTDYDLMDPWITPTSGNPTLGEPAQAEPTLADPTPKKTSSSEDQRSEDQKYLAPHDAASDVVDAEVVEDTPNAGQLVRGWIDGCAHRPPSRVIGHVSREVKTLVDDGIPTDTIRNGLVAWQERALHPSVLASVVNELLNASPTRGRAPMSKKEAEDRYIQERRQRWEQQAVAADMEDQQLALTGGQERDPWTV